MTFLTVFVIGMASGVWLAIGAIKLGERRAERKFLREHPELRGCLPE